MTSLFWTTLKTSETPKPRQYSSDLNRSNNRWGSQSTGLGCRRRLWSCVFTEGCRVLLWPLRALLWLGMCQCCVLKENKCENSWLRMRTLWLFVELCLLFWIFEACEPPNDQIKVWAWQRVLSMCLKLSLPHYAWKSMRLKWWYDICHGKWM